jgi:hypothetical protein
MLEREPEPTKQMKTAWKWRAGTLSRSCSGKDWSAESAARR